MRGPRHAPAARGRARPHKILALPRSTQPAKAAMADVHRVAVGNFMAEAHAPMRVGSVARLRKRIFSHMASASLGMRAADGEPTYVTLAASCPVVRLHDSRGAAVAARDTRTLVAESVIASDAPAGASRKHEARRVVSCMAVSPAAQLAAFYFAPAGVVATYALDSLFDKGSSALSVARLGAPLPAPSWQPTAMAVVASLLDSGEHCEFTAYEAETDIAVTDDGCVLVYRTCGAAAHTFSQFHPRATARLSEIIAIDGRTGREVRRLAPAEADGANTWRAYAHCEDDVIARAIIRAGPGGRVFVAQGRCVTVLDSALATVGAIVCPGGLGVLSIVPVDAGLVWVWSRHGHAQGSIGLYDALSGALLARIPFVAEAPLFRVVMFRGARDEVNIVENFDPSGTARRLARARSRETHSRVFDLRGRALALAMAHHPRLGAASALRALGADVLACIAAEALRA